MSDSSNFQRAPGAPVLPHTPFRFVLHFFLQFKGWYGAMIALEGLTAGFGIMIPDPGALLCHCGKMPVPVGQMRVKSRSLKVSSRSAPAF